jgi:hypothetical protein
MALDAEHFRKYYASLSDGELEAINRNDLTEMAQKIFDREIERRGLTALEAEPDDITRDPWDTPIELDDEDAEDEPDDDDEPFVATTFSDPADVVEAMKALEAAGIPCQTDVVENDEHYVPRNTEHRVLVPNGLALPATSILNRDYYNQRMEEEWKLQFSSLTDEQLTQLNPDLLVAGFLDQAERLRRAYNEERRRRKL